MRQLARIVRIAALPALLAAASPEAIAHAPALLDGAAAASGGEIALMQPHSVHAAASLPTDMLTGWPAMAPGTTVCDGCGTLHAQLSNIQSSSDQSGAAGPGHLEHRSYNFPQGTHTGPAGTRAVNLAILALGTAWLMLMWRRSQFLRQAGALGNAGRRHAAGGR